MSAHDDRDAMRGAPGLGQPRPADRRGRGRARRRRGRPRDRAGRRLDAARARRVDLRDGGAAFGGLDVHARGRPTSNGEIARGARRAATRATRPRSTARLIELDGTPNKARLGGNATHRRLDGRGACRGRGARACRCGGYLGGADAALLPLPRDPDLRRRRACRPARRHPGLHGRLPGGARASPQALDWTAEVYRAAGRLLAERGPLTGVADEGGWWPDVRRATRRRSRRWSRRSSAPASRPASEVAIALDVAASRVRPRRPLPARPRRRASSTPTA